MSEQNKIDEIKEALAAATPGPWEWSVKNRILGDDNEFAVGDLARSLGNRIYHSILDVQTNKWGQPMIYCWNEGAADLIAKSPEYITYLLQEIERKDEALKWYASRWNHEVQLEDAGLTSMQLDKGQRAREAL